MFSFVRDSKYRSLVGVLVVTFGLFGCEETTEINAPSVDASVVNDQYSPQPDAGINQVAFQSSESLSLVFQTLVETVSDATWPLMDARILWRSDDRYFVYESGQSEEVVFNGLEILHAVSANDELLISTTNGLMVLRDNAFVPSPLQSLVNGNVRLIPIDEDGFWLIDDTSIRHWRNGRVTHSQLSGRNTNGLSMFARASDNRDELLVWEGMSARRIVFEDEMFTEVMYGFDAFPTDIGLSADRFWVLNGSRIFMLDESHSWQYGDLPNRMEALYTHAGSGNVYLRDETNLWRLSNSTLVATPIPDGLRNVSVHASGGLLVSTTETIELLNAELTAVLSPVASGPLTAPQTVVAQVNIIDGLENIEWRLDGAIVAEDSLTFMLEPMALSPGNHTLQFSASLPPEQSVSVSLNFEGPPSWEDVVAPISESFCVNCHGDDSRIQLLTHQDWVETFDLILYDVETGRMPLTAEKLTEGQVDLIRGWGAAGFPWRETP